MLCPKCNNEIPNDAQFCPICGESMAPAQATPAEPVTPVAPAAEPVQPAPQQAAPAQPQGQPVYQQPQQPVNGQPMYQQPQGQPMNGQPMYNQQGQPMYAPQRDYVQEGKAAATSAWATFKEIMLNPGEGASSFVASGQTGTTWIFLVLQWVVMGLISFVLAAKVDKLAGGFVDIPKFGIFFATAIFVACRSFLYALDAFCVAKIQKSTCGFMHALRFAAVRSAVILFFAVISFVLCLLNPSIGLVVLTFSSSIVLCYSVEAAKGFVGLDTKKAALFAAIVYLVLTIFEMLVTYAIASTIIDAVMDEILSELGGSLLNSLF